MLINFRASHDWLITGELLVYYRVIAKQLHVLHSVVCLFLAVNGVQSCSQGPSLITCVHARNTPDLWGSVVG